MQTISSDVPDLVDYLQTHVFVLKLGGGSVMVRGSYWIQSYWNTGQKRLPQHFAEPFGTFWSKPCCSEVHPTAR